MTCTTSRSEGLAVFLSSSSKATSRALAEVARVLRPGGLVLLAEHALAPDASVAKWQHRLDGLWGKIAGGCHINRDMRGLLDSSPFSVREWQGMYLPQTPRIAGDNVWGRASLT